MWYERLGLRCPVLQAGMGGAAVKPELAAAVSRAGGLGTVGNLPPPAYARAIRRAKELCEGRPVAANLLLPFTREAHVDACVAERPAVVSLFFGFRRSAVRRLRDEGIYVLHQVGTSEQARRALADGADGLIVQGREAGGHLLAQAPLAEILAEMVQLAGTHPVIAAGGIHDRASAARAAEMGASGVAAGTRFLLTHESGIHPAYAERLLAAKTTIVTKLFGVTWPADHRVVPNLATERWCAGREAGPSWVTAFNALTVPARWLASPRVGALLASRQRVSRPFFSPQPLASGMPADLVDVTPLYAGACVTAIHALASVEAVVEELAQGFAAGARALRHAGC